MPHDERHDPISAYDDRGRPFLVSRKQWAEEVLPNSLHEAWRDPERLRAHVVVAVEDGFADVVLDAALRLSEIDPSPYRAAAALALVQLANGDFLAAQETLRQSLDDLSR